MADYDWFDNGPSEAEKEASHWRSQGFHPVWVQLHIGSSKFPDFYRCRRGCGTLVWEPREHIKNVCPEWSPVVG